MCRSRQHNKCAGIHVYQHEGKMCHFAIQNVNYELIRRRDNRILIQRMFDKDSHIRKGINQG
jgi:hypothetical protein